MERLTCPRCSGLYRSTYSTRQPAAHILLMQRPMADSLRSVLLLRIRVWLALFMIGLALSGITAFPLERETAMLNAIFHVAPTPPAGGEPALQTWLRRVHEGIAVTNRDYPFMAYGTDWLAFGHLVIAIAFLGPLLDPVRNKWVLHFGL